MADVFVTNFNSNFTGVSATAANVIRQQVQTHDLRLVGQPLPGCPDPISIAAAQHMTRQISSQFGVDDNRQAKPFAIWHVRRNTEMRAAIWARDVLKLPLRTVFTSAAQRRHSAYPRWLISRMDAVIATTDAAASYMGNNLYATVPHGVDCNMFSPAPNRAAAWKKLGYTGDRGIASIGRVRPEKGTDVFVRAMIELLPKLPDVTALVIGRTAKEHQRFKTDLEREITAAGLAQRILFIGEVSPSALPSVMAGLSLVMQLPRYEGYGMTPLEGMAAAVPFVGSDTGYYRSFCAQGRTGTIVPLENASLAAQAGHQILSDPQRFATMATAAREVATMSFSSATEAAASEAVYQQLWAEAP
jgi:mannosyltransferase